MTKCVSILIAVLFISTHGYTQTAAAPSGSGTSEDPYLISTLNNLYWISQTSASWSSGIYFKQTADIDASATSSWDSGAGWTPIGNSNITFNGSYDGQNYIIDNLYISRSGTNYQGLFGLTGSGATIQNLGLKNENLTGNYYTGGLVGWNGGTISKCYVSADIYAATYGGGLAGHNVGNIQTSYSTGSLRGGNRLGGLVGVQSGGVISNSYTSTAVTSAVSQDLYGGLVGDNSGKITNCYACGAMNVNPNQYGGLVGNNAGTVTNSFWDTETTGLSTSAGGTGKTTAEMKTQTTYTGWDFSTIWQIVGGDGANYPDLIDNTNSTLPVELTSFTASANGNNVRLNWQTATEVNNYGFEIQKSESGEQKTEAAWESIGFVNGNGNSNSVKNYSYFDETIETGKYSYRLKQIDNDGKYKYSKKIEVEVTLPDKYALYQNYPNPFNPNTTIKYTIPSSLILSDEGAKNLDVKLVVYDILGNEVVNLVNEIKQPGEYEV